MSVDDADWTGLRDPRQLESLFPQAREHKLTAPAHTGVAVLLHHSLFHRGTARISDPSDSHPWRPMFKFIFSSELAAAVLHFLLAARSVLRLTCASAAALLLLLRCCYTVQELARPRSPHGTPTPLPPTGIAQVCRAEWKARAPRSGDG
jgi:hypothetical protein